MTTYWLERAWTGNELVSGLLVEVRDGVFSRVEPGPPEGAERLAGLTIPGLANCHSHAFHRALRGRTHRGAGGGTFWTWREQMYSLAATLTPDSYFELARATYREMVSTGITSVGEFHYLHHGSDGTPYDDPNAMSHALVEAAHEAGLRISLLDTCYLAAGIGRELEGVQRRFGDGDADAWAERTSAGPATGAAIHSVRAVPREQMPRVVEWAGWSHGERRPLHVHVSEQTAENDQCLQAYGVTPTRVLAEAGALSPYATLVHATHLTSDDLRLIGEAGPHLCFCPTTERDLGDGIGPSIDMHRLGGGGLVTFGSDSHAVIDLFEEMRGFEMHERLVTHERARWRVGVLLRSATSVGHSSLGRPDVGRIEVGQSADLVVLDTTSVRTGGTEADETTAVYAATGADVKRVLVGGVDVTVDPAEVGAELDRVVRAVWESA